MKSTLFTLLLIASSIFFSCKKKSTTPKPTNLTAATTIIKGPTFELAWETDTVFKTTESCLYDAKHGVIYVSNVNDAPRTKDNNGFISMISTKGKLLKLDWATGMSAPKGMCLFNETLFVTDIDAVLEIDLHSGKTIKKHVLEGALMLNDITIDEKGTVYVSAMDTNKIYTLEDGDFTLWKDNLNKPNGLLIADSLLLVASFGDGTFKAFDRTTKEEKKVLATGLGKADGIVKLNSGNYVVSDWLGEVFYIKNGKATSMLNTIENKNLQTADIGSIPNKNIILVPTFFGNSVKAYKLKE